MNLKIEEQQATADVATGWRSSVLPAGVNLPADEPRTAATRYGAGRVRQWIDGSVLKNLLANFQGGEGASLASWMILLAATTALLARLSADSDFVLSVWDEDDWLPLQATILSGMTFVQLLLQQRSRFTEARLRGPFPYETLDAGRQSLGGVCFSPNAATPTAHDCDLTVRAIGEGQKVGLDWEYNAAIYKESTILRWTEHLDTLVHGAAQAPATEIRALPLLSAGQKDQMLVQWNATAADYPRELCAYELIEQQCRRTPDGVAAQFDEETLTYRELDEQSNQLAHYLRNNGVTSGTVVGIYLNRSLDMLVGLLGIMKSGAGYLPIDPAYPKDRIEFILEDSQVAVLLSESGLEGTLSDSKARVIYLDRERGAIGREGCDSPQIHAQPGDIAYMIYTSGSTGKPKGVEIPQRALTNLLVSMAKRPGMQSDDVLLAVTTLCFDIAAMEVFLPLTVGARLVIARREAGVDPLLLKKLLHNCGATIMQATPVTWRILLEAGWDGRPLKKILCGGEAMPRDLAERLLALGSELWNMYGPTETTIWSSTARVISGTGRVPIGPPIENTQFYVLDELGQPAPVGVAGELCIGGDGVARGYHHRPELTAEKFVADPYRPGERMYRTGDQARYLADGSIDFLGRLDHQIKLRGFRIEVEEIESVLRKHPSIKQAVVAVKEFSAGNQRLVAYIVPTEGAKPDRKELDSFAEAELPDYMVPGAYVVLADLPLTANGKIDRKALPEPKVVLEAVPAVLPQGILEEKIAAIWRKTLNLTQVGVEDRFFDLGGDSLQLLTVKSELEKGIAPELTVVELFEYPTIRALAAYLEKGMSTSLGAAQERGRKQSQSWARFKPQRQKA